MYLIFFHGLFLAYELNAAKKIIKWISFLKDVLTTLPKPVFDMPAIPVGFKSIIDLFLCCAVLPEINKGF